MHATTKLPVLALLAATLAAAGCANYTEPVVAPGAMTPAERNFEAAWLAAREVLGRYDFQIDREDRRSGTITTLPMTGKHWWEFWRKDAATRRDLIESTLQTIYRQAKVSIRPAGADGYQVSVEVQAYRSNLQELQVTNTSEAYDLFTLPGEEKERKKHLLEYVRDDDQGGAQDRREWMTPLGRDAGLEAKLAADIRAAAGRRAGAPAVP
ncbi:MAG TPA: hypothetical protein PK082_11620 [Phycisphaerae bacterium]|nr:hypothetical protein [Phycisphaerae bacterium]